MRRALAVVVAIGCGRMYFDDRGGDAGAIFCASPAGHDEDQDGVDDACDGCPHIPDPEQLDSDGDGVDDVCDPNPGSPRETIAFFDPFVTLRPEWQHNWTPTIVDDSMWRDADPVPVGSYLGGPVIADVFTFGGRLGAPVGRRQLTMSVSGPPPMHYFCELTGDATSSYFAATYTYDATAYTLPAFSDGQALVEEADLRFSLFHAPPNYGCETSFPVTMSRLEAPIPAGIPAEEFAFGVYGVALRVDYFIHIRTQ